MCGFPFVSFDWIQSPETVWRLQQLCGIRRRCSYVRAKVRGSPNKGGKNYSISNKWLYWFFKTGCILGQEEFYLTFCPFWMWNVDETSMRKLLYIWALTMYLGHVIKEVLQVPRPKSPPVVILEHQDEFSMPSTHAVVASETPVCLYLFYLKPCQVSAAAGAAIAVVWILWVCLSRVYVGVHTILEVLAGLALSFIVMLIMIPFAQQLDTFLMTNWIGLSILFLLAMVASFIFPSHRDDWTPVWADTVAIISVMTGIPLGFYLSYNIGILEFSSSITHCPEMNLFDLPLFGKVLLKTFVGFCLVLIGKVILKRFFGFVIPNCQKLRRAILVQICTYFTVGLVITFAVPIVFHQFTVA